MMKHQGGFTIAELIIVVVIAAVLAAIAVPNMSEFIKDNSRSARLNTMVTALNYARNQAVTLNRRVSLCKSANVTAANPTCDAVAGGGNFEDGWIVITDHIPPYADPPFDNPAVGKIDPWPPQAPLDPRWPNETVLRRFNPDMGNSTLVASNTGGAIRGISFDATGLGYNLDPPPVGSRPVSQDTEFAYCDDRNEGRTIEITPTGFARVAGTASVCP